MFLSSRATGRKREGEELDRGRDRTGRQVIEAREAGQAEPG